MLRGLICGALARPCTVIVGALLIVVLGGLCLTVIPVDILPVNSSPAVQVLTFYGGMPATTVEKNITSRLERQTGQASGRTRQESRSIIGASIVRNYFGDDVDPNNALAQVNSLATAAAKSMPPGTDPPVILPFDPTGTTPVCIVALDSESHSESTLYDVGRYEVRNMIMGLQGANAPAVHGGRLRAILAYLDRHKLEARHLSPLDVMEALDEYNLFLPTGDAKFGAIDYALGSNAMYQVVEDMGDIPLREESGNAAYLRDVATPVDTSLAQSSLVRVNGKRQVYIPVYRQPGASTLSVVDSLKGSLDTMVQRLSRSGIDLKVVMDQSVYVRHSIKALIEEGVLGAIMCSLVILLFLGNGRMTAIALLTIPLSVLAAIVGLYATGNTINVMTLAGLSLAIGPLVDLAVICLENTHRHLVLGRSPREAALHGTSEVATPALVATFCTLIVLAPLAFLPELGDFLFKPMAVAVAFAMGSAYLLSQTLVPLCCSAWLKPHRTHEAHADKPPGWTRRLWNGCTGQLDCLNDRYELALDWVLRNRAITTGTAVLLMVASVNVLGPRLRQEFFPEVDAGSFEMTVRAPSGSRLELTEQRLAEVESLIQESVGDDLQLVVSEAGVVADWSAAYTPNSGPMDAVIKVQLTEHRLRSAQKHVQRLRTRLREDERFADLEFGFDTGGLIRAAMNGGKSTPINISLTGRDLGQLREVAERLKEEVSKVEGIVDARILQRLDYPQYIIDVDRTKAADLGLSLPYVIKNVVAALNSSIQFNKKNFYIDPLTQNQYHVGVQYPEQDIESIETLLDIPITSPTQDRAIPLQNLVTLRETTCPTEIVRRDLQSCIDLVMAVEERDLGHTAAEVAGILGRFGTRLPDGSWQPYDPDAEDQALLRGARLELSGEYEKMQAMFRNLGGGCLLATLLVYFLLVSQFQSFRVPLVILAALPISATGVIWMLYLTGTAVNVQSLLGLTFMVGIVVANTVLMIDLAGNLRRDEGLSPTDAIRRAAAVRVRPVLMTALAALLALVPMALALAPGSEANAPLGRAVIGGLLAGLVTTLFVVPCIYSLMERNRTCAA